MMVMMHRSRSGETADEDGLMSVKDLERAIKACKNDLNCRASVEQLFVQGGGTVTMAEGGKVFVDQTGGKVFIPDPN